MKIFIFVENEEMGDLKELKSQLEKKGAQVNFQAIKFRDNDVRADQILTLPHHHKVVKEMFKGRDVPIQLIEPTEQKEVKLEEGASEPTAPVLVIPEPTPEPELIPEPVELTEGPIVLVQLDDLVVTEEVKVVEEDSPEELEEPSAPAGRRSRKS